LFQAERGKLRREVESLRSEVVECRRHLVRHGEALHEAKATIESQADEVAGFKRRIQDLERYAT
jgi:chromosome segregation ATPase